MSHLFMTIWIALLAGLLAQPQNTAPVNCPPVALTDAQVLDLVKGGLPEGRVAQIVATCHVGFLPANELLERMSQRGVSEAILRDVIKDGYSRVTLAQARVETTGLDRELVSRTASNGAARDSELARVDAEYAPRIERAEQISPRDQFESTAAFNAREQQAKAALADLERARESAKQQVSGRYAAELAAHTGLLNLQLLGLKGRTYQDEGVKLEFLRYDADDNRLVAAIGGTEYWFTIPNGEARDLYGHWSSARVERNVEEDSDRTRTLLDLVSGERYTGVPREVAAAVAANEAERKRLENLARVTWIDPNSGLMGGLEGLKHATWAEADSFCGTYRVGGYTDWRLADRNAFEEVPREQLQKLTKGSDSTIWTSTPARGSLDRRLVFFVRAPTLRVDSGFPRDNGTGPNYSGVLCVRGPGK